MDRSDIVWIAGGNSYVGTDRPELQGDGESPARQVRLAPYGIGRYAVTCSQFSQFVDATGYRTDAEKIGWSFVFRGLLDGQSEPQAEGLPWWVGVEGANWKSPTGPASDIHGFQDHPVCHVSYNDAAAYADWVGGRLPSEAEWEHAARGGNDRVRYPWGDDEPDDDKNMFCNIWQGNFPAVNLEKDGYYATAPVHSFEPNAFGLYNMSGNVWEWCADPFRIRSLSKTARKRNAAARSEDERVLKGGSFLCHRSYCWRYRIAARSGRAPDNSASHCGFRVAFDA